MSEHGRQFQLSIRRVNYDNSGAVLMGKWRKAAIHFMTTRQDLTEADVATDKATFGAQIGLTKDLSYQIRLVQVTPDGANLTASVFLDAQEEVAIGKLFVTRAMLLLNGRVEFRARSLVD